MQIRTEFNFFRKYSDENKNCSTGNALRHNHVAGTYTLLNTDWGFGRKGWTHNTIIAMNSLVRAFDVIMSMDNNVQSGQYLVRLRDM